MIENRAPIASMVSFQSYTIAIMIGRNSVNRDRCMTFDILTGTIDALTIVHSGPGEHISIAFPFFRLLYSQCLDACLLCKELKGEDTVLQLGSLKISACGLIVRSKHFSLRLLEFAISGSVLLVVSGIYVLRLLLLVLVLWFTK
jgi:hypothetical protein